MMKSSSIHLFTIPAVVELVQNISGTLTLVVDDAIGGRRLDQ